MEYVLACLSHGDPTSPWQERTLTSFADMVDPAPAVTLLHHDGPGKCHRGGLNGEMLFTDSVDRRGFCGATRTLWQIATRLATDREIPFVFWLEHDFVFNRPVDLEAISALLLDPNCAQVAMMRQPVNAQERAAGSVVDSRPGEFTADRLITERGTFDFMRQRSYFTTNPSLMRTDFMAAHTFGDDRRRLPQDIECEGKFGAELIALGFEFVAMGHGEPWVEHIGQRTGGGY